MEDTNRDALIDYTKKFLESDQGLKGRNIYDVRLIFQVISEPRAGGVVVNVMANIVGSMNNLLIKNNVAINYEEEAKVFNFTANIDKIANTIAAQAVLGDKNLVIDSDSITLYIGKGKIFKSP